MKSKKISEKILKQFESYLKSEEKSKNTVKKYIRDAAAFAEYLGENCIDKVSAIAYKQNLIDSNYAVSSVNSIIASLNSLFAFMGLSECKLKSVKLQRKAFCTEEKELTKAEYSRLIHAARQKNNTRIGLIIQTICCTGIRVSELPFITVQAVQKGEATVSLKGKTRIVIIVKKLKKKLLCYIAEQQITNGCVFITRSGKPVNRTNIWREMKSLCKIAKVSPSKVFPHNLRHLFARTFYRIERDIARLADILGHSNINTTRIYTVTTYYEHRRLMENMRLTI